MGIKRFRDIKVEIEGRRTNEQCTFSSSKLILLYYTNLWIIFKYIETDKYGHDFLKVCECASNDALLSVVFAIIANYRVSVELSQLENYNIFQDNDILFHNRFAKF